MDDCFTLQPNNIILTLIHTAKMKLIYHKIAYFMGESA